MTELLPQTDSYLRTFAATVVGVNNNDNAVTLDRTALYPVGGLQK